MSTIKFLGILLFSASLHAQISQYPETGLAGELYPQNGFVRPNLSDSFRPSLPPIAPDWPEPPAPALASGVVSLRELQHPIRKKALQAAYEAQQYSKRHETLKAVAKLEKSIEIDPTYRDAHCNLGVQYARLGRNADAHAEFLKALDIGPPAAIIYADLALVSSKEGHPSEARAFARKAVEMDPGDGPARALLQGPTP